VNGFGCGMLTLLPRLKRSIVVKPWAAECEPGHTSRSRDTPDRAANPAARTRGKDQMRAADPSTVSRSSPEADWRVPRLASRSLCRSTLQSAFGLVNGVRRRWYRRDRLIGDDGARPEVGWNRWPCLIGVGRLPLPLPERPLFRGPGSRTHPRLSLFDRLRALGLKGVNGG
jgi:hypothetical protein